MNGGTEVLDYQLWSDQATDVFMPVISNLAATSYLVTGLSVGDSYKFKVKARNAFGYSEFSEVVEILAAQVPDKPDAPVTTFDRTTVVITWTAPFD